MVTRRQGSAREPRSSNEPRNSDKEGAELDKVRDILFGAQQTEFANRVEELEAAISQDVGSVKRDLQAEIAELRQLLEAKTKLLDQKDRNLESALEKLGAQKTDRSQLAALLHRVASELEKD